MRTLLDRTIVVGRADEQANFSCIVVVGDCLVPLPKSKWRVPTYYSRHIHSMSVLEQRVKKQEGKRIFWEKQSLLHSDTDKTSVSENYREYKPDNKNYDCLVYQWKIPEWDDHIAVCVLPKHRSSEVISSDFELQKPVWSDFGGT